MKRPKPDKSQPRPTLGFELPTFIPFEVNAAGKIEALLRAVLGLDRPEATLSVSVSRAAALIVRDGRCVEDGVDVGSVETAVEDDAEDSSFSFCL